MWDGVNRRNFPRAEYPCLITVRKNTAPVQAVLTHTEDLSINGVRVLIREKIELQSEVDLEIDLKDTLATVLSKGIVKWVQEIPPHKENTSVHHDTGIEFIGLKAEDESRIKAIIDHLLSAENNTKNNKKEKSS